MDKVLTHVLMYCAYRMEHPDLPHNMAKNTAWDEQFIERMSNVELVHVLSVNQSFFLLNFFHRLQQLSG